MDINEVRDLIESKLAPSMALVRRSLVRAASIDPAMESAILSGEYDEPRGLVPPIFILRGDLSLKDPTEPPPPELNNLELDFPLPEPTAIEKGDGEPVEITFQPNMTVLSLPENVVANVRGTGLRAAHVKNFSSELNGVHHAEPKSPPADS